MDILSYEKVAKAFASNFNIDVRFQGDQAYVKIDEESNRFVIVLPDQHTIISKSIKDRTYLNILDGYLDHEIGELTYTNHGVVKNIIEVLTEKHSQLATETIFMYANMINDLRVNNCMSDAYPGCRLNISYVMQKILEHIMKDLLLAEKELPEKPFDSDEVPIIFKMRILASVLMIKFYEEFFPEVSAKAELEAVPLFRDATKKIDEFGQIPKYIKKIYENIDIEDRADGTKESFKIAKDLANELAEFLRPPPPPPKPPEPEDGDGEEEEGEEESESDGDTNEDEEESSGGGTKNDKEEEGEEEEGEEEEGEEGDAECIGEKSGKEDDITTDVLKQILAEIEEKLDATTDEEFETFKNFEKDGEAEMLNAGKSEKHGADYVGMVSPMSIEMSREINSYEIDNHMRNTLKYNNDKPIPEHTLNSLRGFFTRFKKKLLVIKRTPLPKETDKGKIYPTKIYRIAKNSNMIFKKPITRKGLDTAVSILLDGSGSVLGNPRKDILRASMMVFAEMLNDCRVPYETRIFFTDFMDSSGDPGSLDFVNTFNRPFIEKLNAYGRYKWRNEFLAENLDERHNPRYVCVAPKFDIVIKSFEDDHSVFHKNLDCVNSPGGANSDPYAILQTAKSLAKRKEKRKILIILSDFRPHSSNPYGNDFGGKDMQTIFKEEIISLLTYLRGRGILSFNLILGSTGWRKGGGTWEEEFEQNDLGYYILPEDITVENMASVFGDIVDKLI